MSTAQKSQSRSKTNTAARSRTYERVSISCPHCWGTGDMRLFDGLESRLKRDCIFCEGLGKLSMEVAA